MKLISCPHCGVVLDQDKIKTPEIWDDDGAMINPRMVVWNGDVHVPLILCPVCEDTIELEV